MGKFFGTDGVRGKANQDLTPAFAFTLGQAAALVFRDEDQKGKIVIGGDTRISSGMLGAALAAGICSAGMDVMMLGTIPTPGVAVLSRHLKARAGAVISASHNKFADNGIKFFTGSGSKLSDDLENALESKIEELQNNPARLPKIMGEQIGRLEYFDKSCDVYAGQLRQKLPLNLSGLKIILDTANGAAYQVGPELLRSLGAQVLTIGAQPDGCNINAGCGSTHPEQLMAAVIAHQANLGIALDGDADRMLAVDETGSLLDGDCILAIFARHLKALDQLPHNLVIATIMSNVGLRLSLAELDIEVKEAGVGDRYVLEMMEQTGAVLGGEQSGHLIFTNINSTGDGLGSALYLLKALKESGQPLSRLKTVMKPVPQVLLNVPVSSKEGWQEDKEIGEAIKSAKAKLGNEGRILVRASGTESLLRVLAEGPDKQEIASLVNNIATVITSRVG
ncbi:MAG: phosphoglucosamine mutase [Clostridiales bacterium]|jgi:phosphoglucosamine mutase|nr:phosphoglucosamine mutase [Clostridiales bacterium]